MLHGETVEPLVRLSAQRLNSVPLPRIQHPDLDKGLVDIARHLPTEGIDLPDHMPLGWPPD